MTGLRVFRHLDQDWEVGGTGVGIGQGWGDSVKADITHHGVEFRLISDGSNERVSGLLSQCDPNNVSEGELTRALDRALGRA